MRFFRRLSRRPRIKLGLIETSASGSSPIRNSQFVSFFSAADCAARRHVDHHDLRLRRHKWAKLAAALVVVAGVTWVVVESAHALSSF